MPNLINGLTNTRDWDRKVFDPDFTFSWKSAKTMTGQDLTRSMVDWVRYTNNLVRYFLTDSVR